MRQPVQSVPSVTRPRPVAIPTLIEEATSTPVDAAAPPSPRLVKALRVAVLSETAQVLGSQVTAEPASIARDQRRAGVVLLGNFVRKIADESGLRPEPWTTVADGLSTRQWIEADAMVEAAAWMEREVGEHFFDARGTGVRFVAGQLRRMAASLIVGLARSDAEDGLLDDERLDMIEPVPEDEQGADALSLADPAPAGVEEIEAEEVRGPEGFTGTIPGLVEWLDETLVYGSITVEDERLTEYGRAVRPVRIATGGFSADEDLVRRVETGMLSMFWRSTHRGGLFCYEVDAAFWESSDEYPWVAPETGVFQQIPQVREARLYDPAGDYLHLRFDHGVELVYNDAVPAEGTLLVVRPLPAPQASVAPARG